MRAVRHAGAARGGAAAAEQCRGAATLAPARRPVQRPADARLLVIDGVHPPRTMPRAHWPMLLQAGDVVIGNDAATLPASLRVVHARTGAALEIRLAGHVPPQRDGRARFDVVAFGSGDWRTRTEHRRVPPLLVPGDVLVSRASRSGAPRDCDAPAVRALRLTVLDLLGHPRLVRVRLDAPLADALAHLAHAGRPVQYAHLEVPLSAWDVATPIAAQPVAFEAPSAGFAVDWAAVAALQRRGVRFATLTHAAGLSSTGDAALDARLPLPEGYRIPADVVGAVDHARSHGGRVVAIGTTVVRALEHAAAGTGGLHAGGGVADQRIGPGSTLRVIDAILSGVHEPGSSHHELLRAFVDDAALDAAHAAMLAQGYRSHEFGDSMLVMRTRPRAFSPTP